MALKNAALSADILSERVNMPEQRHRGPAIAHVPYPMWVYDLETFAFLDVNAVAIATYGFSREEFLKMTLLDIRPSEDVAKFLRENNPPHQSTAEEWLHKRKDGTVFSVSITSWKVAFNGRPAEIVLARPEEEKAKRHSAGT